MFVSTHLPSPHRPSIGRYPNRRGAPRVDTCVFSMLINSATLAVDTAIASTMSSFFGRSRERLTRIDQREKIGLLLVRHIVIHLPKPSAISSSKALNRV